MIRFARSISSFLLLTGFFAVACPLHAQGLTETDNPANLSIEDLFALRVDSVYAASKHPQTTLQAPASVTIVTSDEIQRYGYRDLADVLRHVRGFYATYDRNYEYIGTRGFSRPGDYGSRFLQLVDGHRMNDNIFDSVLAGTDFVLDLALIDRIEVIRGPASSLYGDGAFFAVINIVTKKGKALDGTLASATGGNQGTSDTLAAWGQRFGRRSDFMVSLSRYFSDGQRKIHYSEFDTAAGPGLALNQDMDVRESIFSQATIGDFSFQTMFGSRTKMIPTGSFGTVLDDPRNHTRDWRGYIDGTYKRQLPAGWQLDSRTGYDRYGYDGIYAIATDSAGSGESQTVSALNKDIARGHWLSQEVRISRKFEDRNMFTGGSEFRRNFHQDLLNFDLQPLSSPYLDQRHDSNNWAMFAQQEITVSRNLTLNLGIRHDNNSSFGGSTSPRAAVIINPDSVSAIKLTFGQAFRAPNVYELYWRQPGFDSGNIDLRPETIRTAELGYERKIPRGWAVSTQLFHYSISSLINQSDPDMPGFVNAGNIDATGWESDVERKTPSGFEMRFSYSFQTSRERATGSLLTNSPRQIVQGKIGNAWLKQRIWTGVDFYALSSRLTLEGRQSGAYLVPNVTIGTDKPIHGLDFKVTLYNAGNAQYGDPGGEEHRQDLIAQDGRTFRVKVTYSHLSTPHQ